MTTSEQATGIIVKKVDYSNTSIIFHFLSHDKGLIHIIAKGAKNKKSPFAGKIEFFQTITCLYAKQGSSDLYILKECSYLDEFRILKDNINLFFIGSYMIETISALQFDDEDAGNLYRLITTAFRAFERSYLSYEIVIVWYLAKIMVIIGYPPRTDKCIYTKHPFNDTVYPVTQPCLGFANRLHHSPSAENFIALTKNDVKLLESVMEISDPDKLSTVTADSKSVSRILGALGLFIKTTAGKELKTYKTVQSYFGIQINNT
ncbi:MAG: DNA repair protein RecO [Candidatus Auribacterota bacterium]|jgi:DNA repair protein RecO (recombination protein O)|nr:DNA repair protein RecO [Candidatus Auribacterota bacterium]